MTRARTSTAALIVLLIAARASAQADSTGTGLPAADIEKLVAPIALYPDVLISQILPAATFPTDIVMAARWCQEHADLKGLDDQKWDLSVLSVCRYPQVLAKMNTDLDWTNALGAAYLEQPDDVMTAIQDLRARTKDAGVLVSNPQQTVVTEAEVIRIVPTEKEIVYVPQYDPQVIYVDADDDDDDDGVSVAGAVTASALSFGAGLAMGAWLDNDCDWVHGGVVVCRPGYWGGWAHHGAVAAWDNNWVAARGPRRGVVAGENGGVYRGPNGAAIWGENGHGAAWSRGSHYGTPAYTGRYSDYNNVSNNRRNVAAGNTVNVNNSKNVNIDRGDRNVNRGNNNINTGNRTNVGNTNAGNRASAGGGNNVGSGNRNNVGAGDRNNVGGGNRSGGNNPGMGNPGNANHPAQQPRANQGQQNRKPSSMNDNRSAAKTQQNSNRGASSRSGGGGGSRGGGSRGGGGRGR